MYRFFALLFVLCSISGASAGQMTTTISGSVTEQGKPLSTVMVSLLDAADSAWIKTEVTSDNGLFTFMYLPQGKYILNLALMGYEPVMRVVDVTNGTASLEIELARMDNVMVEATVKAKQPFIEVGLGKLVVNVEGSSTAQSNNVLELLRRLPGVSVSQTGTISMHGKQGVLVLVNDRPTYLTGDQLAEYLRAMTATEIAQMELITQPGAKYDAAGNTGVINIKLKRNKKQGLNGNAMLMVGQGVYGNEHSSLLVSYKKNKLNVTMNLTDMRATGFADWVEDQYFTDEQTGAVLSQSHIHSTPKERFSVITARLAADYDCTDKTTIGISSRGAYHPNDMTSHVLATRYDNITGIRSYNDILNPDGFIRKDVTTNAYLSHKFGKESTLDINADYLTYGNALRQSFTNAPLDAQMQPAGAALLLRSKHPSSINVYSLKADYTYGFGNGIKLEAGAKSSVVRTDNDAQFSILQGGDWVNDTMRTNRFVYNENINALYLTLAKEFSDKWNARAGLRAEQTNAKGVQYVHDNTFTRTYLSLFPTVFIGYKADTNNQFELNYGRRIDRPAYQMLNPFIHYSFQYSYFAGNPNLLPQYTNNIELKHSYKNMLITTISLSATSDIITDVVIADNVSKIVYGINKNLAQSRLADVSLVFNKDITSWLSFNASGDVYYAHYSGVVGASNVVNEGIGYALSAFAQLDFGKGWKAELQCYYSGRQINAIMGVAGESIYSSAGVSKKVGEHINIRAAFEDPFYKYRLINHNVLPGFRSDNTMRMATQTANVSFTYSFGNGQARQHRSSMEEKGRMKVD